jgi:hypothetical protein
MGTHPVRAEPGTRTRDRRGGRRTVGVLAGPTEVRELCDACISLGDTVPVGSY